MAITRTLKLLPEVFRSDVNEKFLNATLDQLVTEPDLVPINGYIGRKSSPGFSNIHEYVLEPDADRADYQLEPGVVVKNPETGTVDFHITYPELLQKIRYYGGITTDPNRLFSTESYSYDPKINLDAFVNFSEYYWLPQGPDPVDVFASSVDLVQEFRPNVDLIQGIYRFTDTDINPDITLGRGGVYTFTVNQPGQPFWIQTEPGTSGVSELDPAVSTRDIFGVTGNGTDVGEITFRVPSRNEQDFFSTMPRQQVAEGEKLLATTLRFADLYNRSLASVVSAFGGIDSITDPEQINNSLLIFVNADNNPASWDISGVFDYGTERFDSIGFEAAVSNLPVDTSGTTEYTPILLGNRHDLWRITLADNGDGSRRIVLTYEANIPVSNKIKVTSGLEFRQSDWYKTTQERLARVPSLTAGLDRLYYQSGATGSAGGIIRIIDAETNLIYVDVDILNRPRYTSPNGVRFTNGLKVRFDTSCAPAQYQNREYYVDGVGSAIRLTPVLDLELDDDDIIDITVPDYMTINRSSLDKNPWSRSNRWFHQQILADTARYNGTVFSSTQYQKARRPIIEFQPDIKLFNSGFRGLAPVDIIDTIHTRPFIEVEGQTGAVDNQNTFFQEGQRVIFTEDADLATRGKIYRVTFVDIGVESINPAPVIHLEEEPDVVELYSTVRAKRSNNKNKFYWFNGSKWVEGQNKQAVNQPPMFDVFDPEGNSYGDLDLYPINNAATQFLGTKLFNYRVGRGAADPVLGMPLAYKNITSTGDIIFENSLDSQTFTYALGGVEYTQQVGLGTLRRVVDNELELLVPWRKITEPLKQYQLVPYIYSGQDAEFRVDVKIEESVRTKNLRVLVNFKEITEDYFTRVDLARGGHDIVIDENILKTGDRVDILFYSLEPSALGFYTIPDNLNYNAQNFTPSEITLGEMRNHATNLAQSTVALTGSFPGVNNSRDIDFNSGVGKILQHSAPVSFAALFLGSEKFNFVDSVRLAEQEYSRFKIKFLSLAEQLTSVDVTDARAAVDAILTQINAVKNSTFPWARSDMVPYGENKNTITYRVLDTTQRSYQISEIFNSQALSDRAVLVYYNNTQILLNRDYVFLADSPAINFLPAFNLTVGDTITIVEYRTTDGNYIPETPSKMGLWPRYRPEIFVDDTLLQGPTSVIRGHDGSITPAFGDYRDNLLLELERRIYNNIKVNFNDRLIDIWATKPGKFRNNRNYTRTELETTLSRYFLTWAGANNLDYSDNDVYDANNNSTFNYSSSHDILDGELLPGSWRAIFEYYYDCQAPQWRPWEMLGFTEQPSWWVSEYGPAPYTSEHTLLWEDLEQGIIRQGSRAGVDSRFARPGLQEIIPVDEDGRLRSPLGLLTREFNGQDYNQPWVAGSWGRVETAWRRSSNYPFAAQILAAITNPANYFSLGINTSDYYRDATLDQFVVTEKYKSITQADVKITGSTDSQGNIVRGSGYLNWIAERRRSLGVLDSTELKKFIDNYNIQLSYRLGGFTDKSKIKVIADQYSPNSTNLGVIIPDDDFSLIVNKSTPLAAPTYSAVILERTSSGWSVSGYDVAVPYFTVAVPAASADSDTIKVLKHAVEYPTRFSQNTRRIPYGTEFTSRQEVTDFIAGWEKSLVEQGFIFNTYNAELAEVCDWRLSVREFLFWEQQGWRPGSILVVSPVSNSLEFQNDNSVIDEIRNDPFNSRIMDQNFKTLGNDSYTVSRIGNRFKVSLDNSTDLISLAKLSSVQYEHVLVFNNRTQFNDVIFDPATGQRQYRMKLVGSRTGNWTGQYDAPGFIYNSDKVNAWKVSTDYRRGDLVEYKNFYYAAKDNIIASTEFNFTDWTPVDKNKIKSGLLSGFSTNAGQGRNFYDIESFNGEDKFDRYSLGLIGYRSRSYLDNLGINDTTQVKFYQGFVKEKGTKKSIDALKQLSFGDNTSEISIHEDWAFKVGEYGSLDTNRFIDLTLSEDNVKNNPSSIIVEPGNTLKFNESYELNNGVFRMSSTSLDLPLFLTRTSLSDVSEDLQTAGFADPDDVDYTVFNLATHTWTQDEIDNISVNDTIWCAIDYKNSWNIFKIANPEVAARGITNLLDNVLLITTADVHNFGIEDIIVLKDIDKFSGIYQITGILDDKSFTVTYAGDQDIQDFVGLELENTAILKLDSIKLTHASQVVDLSNSINWDIGNKIYVTDDSTAGWAIYEKSEPWTARSKLNSSRVQANARLGSATSISDNGKFIAAGRPGANNGLGEIVSFSLDKLDKFVETSSLGSTVAGCTELGAAVTNTDTRVIAGAPGTNNNSGVVVIYDQNTAGIIIEDTVIAANTQNADGRYGQSVATTQDGQWLFVGAPGLHSVFVYWYQTVTEQSQTFTPAQVAAANDTFNLNFTPDNIGLLRVTDNQYTYVPYRDYTITGNVLTVSNISAAGNYGNLTVTQQSNYVLYDTLVGASGSEFGWSVSCSSDGRQLIVGCPGDNPGNHAASGSTMIFDRSVEKFIKRIDIPGLGTYSVNSFHTLNNTLKVLVNNQLQVRGQDYTVINNREVQFINEPPVGAVIEIESNKFNVIQMRTEIDPQDKSRFGHCVKMHRTGTSVYVGAPFHNTPDRFEVGVIHRFVNQGRRYGTLTGLTRNPTVVVGDTIRINDFVIEFTGTTLNSVVTDINNAGIPGIQAANVNGYLRLTSNASQQPYNLSVAPCHSMTSTSPLQALGLEVYELSQVIDNPTGKSYDKFGYSIDVNADDTVLAVGSRYAETEKLTTFDIYPRRTSFIVGSSTQYATDTTAAPLAEATTFDSSTTTFNDNFESGAVWMLQSMTDIRNSIDTTDKFTSIQQLTPATIDIPLSSGLEFGSSLILRDQDIIVGASGLSAAISGIANHGGMITFKTTGQFGWDRVSQEDGHVDVNGITKSYIYDKNTRTILGYLDYLDPAKGRILGQAEQELTYKTDYDPAAYNVTDRNDVTESKTLYWSTMQVGQLWWDLSAVRYIEYEQKDITYRTNRWGQQFPGSEIKVYEWVESEYPPSQWVAQGRDGVPLYADDSAYATISYVDKITNVTTAKYYFWVGARTSVPKNARNRKISASDVANYIDNPLGSGIKYLAAIRNDAVAIFNVIDSLKNDDIILHIDYATKLNESIIHSEYSLMSETGSKSTLIPEAIYKKLIDSLSGLDIDGNPVPDQRLPVQLRYGISNTPRQSMFVDRRAAISEMLDYINLVLRENIISRGFDLSGITGGEPPPDNLSNLYDVKTNNRTDFGFININLVPQGYRVLILNDEEFNNQWTIHTKQSNGTWKLTRIQSYNMEDYWDYQDWYASGYDATLLPTWTIAESINLNDIINTVRQGDTIKILNNGQNRWVLLLVNNNAFDLIGLQNGTIQFKDNLHDIDRAGYSFDSSVFDSNVYDKNPSVEIRKIMETIKNNILSGALDDKFVKLFFVFIHYILNEQKNVDWLFKTSFINVLHKIAQLEQLPLYRRNNQDNYRQYIEEVKPYHTTIREYIFNYEKRDEYRVNFSDFDVVPYYDAELNTYRSPTTPADPRESSSILQDREAINLPVNASWLANHDYYVSSIEIEYAGSGYRDVPLITITGSLTNDNARARAVITSGRITSVIVTHPGSGYYTTPTITLSTASQDPGRLSIHLANDTVRKIKTTMIYDRFTYGSSVRVWEANTAYRVGDIVSYNGRAYRVDTAFTSTVFFNSSYLTELPRDYFTNANDRIAAYYVPKPGIPGASAELLQSGIDYPGVIVDSFVYDESGGFDASGSAASFGADFFDNLLVNEDGVYIVDDKVIDKIVEGGSFDDSYNNLPASTVLVDGSSFVDTFSSHAPEELLPGRMFDTMSMTISTANVDPLSERYNNWKNFEGLYVARIIIADPGEGYSLVGTSPITVTISQGDSLTTAVVNRSGITLDSRGNVVAMTLSIQGAGYRSRPNVVITGSNVSPALAYVEMSRPYWETDTTLGTFNYNIFKSQQSYSSLNRLTEIQDGEDLYSYHRIHSTLDQTTLVTAITDTATTLQVTNAAVITDPVITFANVLRNGVTTPVITSATPGSIMIGGEKINFWRRDNNTLSRLMRGADGTGARNHAAGATVTNMGTGNDLYRYFNSQQNMTSIAERLRFKRVDLPNVVVKRKIEPVYNNTQRDNYTFSAQGVAVRTIVFNDRGSIPNPLTLENENPLATDHSNEIITTDQNAVSPATETGFFNGNTAIIRYLKGIS